MQRADSTERGGRSTLSGHLTNFASGLRSYQLMSRLCSSVSAEVQENSCRLSRAFLVGLATFALLIPASAAAERRDEGPSASVDSLMFTYPERFSLRYFTSCDYSVTGVRGACVHGVVVANLRLGRRPELGGTNARLPLTVAKFELVLDAPETGVVAPVPTYPLSLRDFRATCRGCGPLRGRRVTQVSLWFRANDANYWAIAWIGKRISRRDYQALRSIVASIHLS
jgi:hypothetical protein